MIQSPCRSCAHLRFDKNGAPCLHCDKRVAYVAALGDMSFGVPDPLCDLTAAPVPMPLRQKRRSM
jgi:hypothetical protein